MEARQMLLRQPTRRRVFDAIQAEPGTHARALSRGLGLAFGSVEHHVRQLERHGAIFRHQSGRRRSLYVAGDVGLDDAAVIHAVRNPAWARLLAELVDGEWSVAELAGLLEQPASSLSYHLRRMREAGLLEHMRLGRESIYAVADPRRVQHWLAALAPRAPHEAFVGLVARAVVHVTTVRPLLPA